MRSGTNTAILVSLQVGQNKILPEFRNLKSIHSSIDKFNTENVNVLFLGQLTNKSLNLQTGYQSNNQLKFSMTLQTNHIILLGNPTTRTMYFPTISTPSMKQYGTSSSGQAYFPGHIRHKDTPLFQSRIRYFQRWQELNLDFEGSLLSHLLSMLSFLHLQSLPPVLSCVKPSHVQFFSFPENKTIENEISGKVKMIKLLCAHV